MSAKSQHCAFIMRYMIDEIRSLQQQDLANIESLFSTADEYITARSLSDYWLYATLFSDTCLVAMANQQVVGAALAFCDQSDLGDVYLQDLMVAEPARNQGVALALMQTLIQRLQTRNTKRIWLTSELSNQPAMAIWHKLGFTNPKADFLEQGYWVTKDLKGPAKDRVIFELDLTQAFSTPPHSRAN